MKSLLTIIFLGILTSCAGPTNPFGGDIFISQEFKIAQTQTFSDVQIDMSPDRQFYNSPYDLTIKINDPNFSMRSFRYEIIYNNKVLNRWLKSEEILAPAAPGEPVEIRFKNLSILPGNINKIAFLYYPEGEETPVIYNLEVPECLRKQVLADLTISPFEVTPNLKNNLILIAKKYGYNPSLIAALIAQESSFNPKAISVARALGLTQVTPIAHREIAKVKEEWEIYPKFSKLPLFNLKYRLKTSLINPENDWRLDPEKSIEGGIIYLNYLTDYWKHPEKQELLSEAFGADVPMTDILLASYNSGAYRVKKAILSNKKQWLFDTSLLEARKYVMNIKSYCYAFKKDETHEK